VQQRPKIYFSRAILWTYEVTGAINIRTWGATKSGYALNVSNSWVLYRGRQRPTVTSELTTCLCESLQHGFVLQALRNAMGIVARGHDGNMGLGADKVFE
jgi:hypothetical protein